MGWGRMLLLGNWGQQMDIEDTQREIAALRNQIHAQRAADADARPPTAVDREQSSQIRNLQRENEQLEMCVATLARLLHAKGVVTREELEAVARMIDKTP